MEMTSGDALLWAKSHFAKRNLKPSDEWIRACVDFCQSETPSLANNRTALTESVRLQWLDTDINVEGVQSGPQLDQNDFKSDELKGNIPIGPFSLQVQSAVDISKPAYCQLRNLMKADDRNIEVTAERTQTKSWAPAPPKRMLKLVLTDGYLSVQAVEDEPCSDLLDPVSCGLKVTLVGPFQVRRGVILLRSKNIKVLGGVVGKLGSKICLKQHLEKILSKENNNEVCKLPTQTYVPPRNASTLIKYKDVEGKGPRSRPKASYKKENPFLEDDDHIFNQIPDQDLKISDADDDIFKAIETPEEQKTSAPKVKSDKLPQASPIQQDFKADARGARVNVGQETAPKKVKVSQDRSSLPKPPISASELLMCRPFQYLSCLNTHLVDVGSSITIKGCFVTLAGKLSIKDGGNVGKCWRLQAFVTDGSETLKVTLATGLLQEWLGSTPRQYMAMLPGEKATIKSKMKGVSEKLLMLNALLKIVKKIPLFESEVIDVVALNRGHAQQLKIRCQRTT